MGEVGVRVRRLCHGSYIQYIFVKLREEDQIHKILNKNVEFLPWENNRKGAVGISLCNIHSFTDQARRLRMYLRLRSSLRCNTLDCQCAQIQVRSPM